MLTARDAFEDKAQEFGRGADEPNNTYTIYVIAHKTIR
jgi:hypothetical protein